MTSRLDNPSVEDLFTMHSSFRQPRRRRSSHFNRWIHDQQNLPVDQPAEPSDAENTLLSTNDTQCHPYLAYPHLSRLSLNPVVPTTDDGSSSNSYDIVNDEDIPQVSVRLVLYTQSAGLLFNIL